MVTSSSKVQASSNNISSRRFVLGHNTGAERCGGRIFEIGAAVMVSVNVAELQSVEGTLYIVERCSVSAVRQLLQFELSEKA